MRFGYFFQLSLFKSPAACASVIVNVDCTGSDPARFVSHVACLSSADTHRKYSQFFELRHSATAASAFSDGRPLITENARNDCAYESPRSRPVIMIKSACSGVLQPKNVDFAA